MEIETRNQEMERREPTERESRMARLYRSGATLQEIGDEYGLSRERVRQLLARIGVKSSEGGASKARAKKYGMSLDRYKEVKKKVTDYGATPMQCYLSQKIRAGMRGIEWNFTFASWWDVWEASGKWHQRGLHRGCYVMGRLGDKGPYEPGNVEIIESKENMDAGLKRYWSQV